MDYRKEKDAVYLRIDKGENIIESIKAVCREEGIYGGCFQGIGACGKAILSTYIPEDNDFIEHSYEGMLELISLMGNITEDENREPFLHVHTAFSYLSDGEVKVAAGHLKEASVSYTCEVVITRSENTIGRIFDKAAGIEVWKLN